MALVAVADVGAQAACRAGLEACAWDVVTVDSGVDAVVAARRAVPLVVFLDQQLRDVPGRAALEWLRANPALRNVPVVLIAGGVRDDEEIAAIRPDALLYRPVSQRAVERVAAGLRVGPG